MSDTSKDGGPGPGPTGKGLGSRPEGTTKQEATGWVKENQETRAHHEKHNPEHAKQAYKGSKGSAMKPNGLSRDVETPKPTSGPMSTKGPSGGKINNLPEAATPSSKPASDCAMSLDDIKSMGKRIGRY